MKKNLKLMLTIGLFFGLINMVLYGLTIHFPVNRLLNRQSLEITRLGQLGDELEKEIRLYKETRFSGETKLFSQLAALKKDLDRYKTEENEKNVLGVSETGSTLDQTLEILEEWLAEKRAVTPSPAPAWEGAVKIKDPKWEKVDVFTEAKASAKIIGSAEYDKYYLFRQKEDSWYQIEYQKNQLGWIQAQFVEEI